MRCVPSRRATRKRSSRSPRRCARTRRSKPPKRSWNWAWERRWCHSSTRRAPPVSPSAPGSWPRARSSGRSRRKIAGSSSPVQSLAARTKRRSIASPPTNSSRRAPVAAKRCQRRRVPPSRPLKPRRAAASWTAWATSCSARPGRAVGAVRVWSRRRRRARRVRWGRRSRARSRAACWAACWVPSAGVDRRPSKLLQRAAGQRRPQVRARRTVIDWAVIEAWPLAGLVRRSVWAYPVLESVHIAAFAALVGSLLLLELRVFGVQPALPLPAFAWLAVRTALVAFALAAASGSLLFISAATELAANPAFRLKLVLILMAGVNALVFHARDSLRRQDRMARWQAGASLLIWLAVIAAGRMIAYI